MIRKSQIPTQTFIYVLGIVVIGITLVLGYNMVSSVSSKQEQVNKIQFQQSLQNSVNQLSSEYGSVIIKSLRIPPSYAEICFSDVEKKDELPDAFQDKHPLAADSIETGNNVFLLGEKNEFFKVENVQLNTKILCMPILMGKVEISIEGKGDGALLNPTKSASITSLKEGISPKDIQLVSLDYGAQLEIPSGTSIDYLSDSEHEIRVEIAPAPLTGSLQFVGNVYDFKPDGTTFSQPIPITLSYDPAKITDPSKLKIYYFDGTDWIPLQSSFDVDATAHTITGFTNHFTKFIVALLTIKSSKLLRQEALITGLTNMYAPEVITVNSAKRMWIGGWLSNQDVNKEDKIYFSDFQNREWTMPNNSFEKSGFLVNDPSIIIPPSSDGIDRSKWLYMYYTALDKQFIGTPNPWKNVVGFASSTDGGITWTDHGIIINHDNGLNNCGAWAPSALVNGNEIWVYYHGNGDCFTSKFLTRMKLNGWERITTQKIQVHDVAVNVDVAKQGGKYVMVANHPTEKFVYRYESTDGVNWGEQPVEVLIDTEPNLITTPHLEIIDANSYNLYFGFSTSDNLHHDSIHAWGYQLQ